MNKKVMTISTIDCSHPKIDNHLQGLAYDNPEIILRPGIGKKMTLSKYQKYRVLVNRTANLVTVFAKYATYYDKRAEWSASPYYTARLKEALDNKEGRHE